MNFYQKSYIVNITYIVIGGADLGAMSSAGNSSVSPFDNSMWDNFTMYDNFPFVWDSSLISDGIYKRVSGNLIKGYRCKTAEPYEIKHV